MRYLFPYFKKYMTESIIAPLFKMLEACFDIAVPIIVADIINVGISNNDSHYILVRFLILIGMALLGLICSFIAQYFSAKAAVGTATELRHQLLQKIQSFGYTELDTIGTSTLITRMTSDVNQIQNGINMFLRLFLRSPFIVLGALIMSFTINKTLALILTCAVALLAVIIIGIMFITSPLHKNVQKNLDNVTSKTRENLNGVRVIRAFGREKIQHENFKDTNEKLYSAQIFAGKISALMNPLNYVIVNAAIILILWFGANKINGGVMLSGDIIALINYIGQILVELVKLANFIIIISKLLSSIDRVGAVLDTETSMTFGEREADFGNSDEAVRFENVGLQYNKTGDESLSDISFLAKKGATVGIIGGTGSGKTSLVNMIARFYDATSGYVFLGGHPIKEYSEAALRKSVAIVSQNPLLFAGTIRSNLLWGNPDASDDELWDALEKSMSADFVRAKEGGLDAPVSQGGVNFSGGQKQRLTIARALVAKSDILILDDSSSALDYATDAALREALKSLPDNVTVFTVSQRTGSIAHADKILVLDDGKLVAVGTHKELLETCGIYKEIYDSQFQADS